LRVFSLFVVCLFATQGASAIDPGPTPTPKIGRSIGAMGLRKLCDKADGYVSIVFGPPGYRVK
jgi:hypothetical protein